MNTAYQMICPLKQLREFSRKMEDLGYQCFYSKLDEFIAISINDDLRKVGRFANFLKTNLLVEFLMIDWLGGDVRSMTYFPKVKSTLGKRMRKQFESNFVIDPPVLRYQQEFYCIASKYVEKNEFEKVKSLISKQKRSWLFQSMTTFEAERHLARTKNKLEEIDE